MSIYGEHRIPLELHGDDYSISVEKEHSMYVYRRECAGENVEKLLVAKSSSIIIHPIEPVNKPQELTPYLLISLERELVIEPKSTHNFFLTFPIEAGVLVSGTRGHEDIDIFTLTKQKFTLYGTPKSGKVCRYWKSGVFTETPDADPLLEGVLYLRIENDTPHWTKVTQVVFNAYGMKLFYDDNSVAMSAKMEIQSRSTAETAFFDKPPTRGMKKAEEHFRHRKISVASNKFVMEEGL